LRIIRIKRGLTQMELAQRAGMHRNSIRKLENGTTREVTSENASALAAALKTTVSDLGLRVRAMTEARSIRIRRLSPEQRQIVDELLSLPPEDYVFIRGAIERLRKKRVKKSRRGGRQ
jgi:transcriptional regulator with XRE-family HTH domain